MNQEKIGNFISKCRKKKNMTQQDLAERLDVTDRAISNWENGKNMPDLSLFKPLCDIFDITINDLMSGEVVDDDNYRDRLEENIVNTIDYANSKFIKEKSLLSIIFIVIGILISFTAIAIFPSDSSWGGIYSLFGVFISLIGVNVLIWNSYFYRKVLFNFIYILFSLIILFLVDYIGVINIGQAPRFSIVKVTGNNVVYYDTLFYDVVRCNINQENETFKIYKNEKYDSDNIDVFCK